jgi:AraC-like DNA-binding protein
VIELDGGARFVDPILDLIVRAIAEAAGLAGEDSSPRRRTLQEIKRYTLAHLADRDLSPTRVAQACFVSARQLHRLFETEGTTFGTFVKRARLGRIHRDLADPALAHLTIAEVARRHGYRHASFVTRAFTERYGTRPPSFRRAQRCTTRQPHLG